MYINVIEREEGTPRNRKSSDSQPKARQGLINSNELSEYEKLSYTAYVYSLNKACIEGLKGFFVWSAVNPQLFSVPISSDERITYIIKGTYRFNQFRIPVLLLSSFADKALIDGALDFGSMDADYFFAAEDILDSSRDEPFKSMMDFYREAGSVFTDKLADSVREGKASVDDYNALLTEAK